MQWQTGSVFLGIGVGSLRSPGEAIVLWRRKAEDGEARACDDSLASISSCGFSSNAGEGELKCAVLRVLVERAAQAFRDGSRKPNPKL